MLSEKCQVEEPEPKVVTVSPDIAVQVHNVSKCYRVYDKPRDRLKQSLWRGRKHFHKEFWALREISFEVHKGEAIGIIGRNGSGKSTLLQTICGILPPTMGEVEVRGRVAAILELGSGFNPEFTGRENVYLNGAILGLQHAEINHRFDDIASFADIGEFIDQPVKTYSNGMMMRLAFAVQTVIDPDILVVDEVLSVGDIFFVQKCAQRMRELQEKGTTLIFVSHDMASVRDLCQKTILLHQGRSFFQGVTTDAINCYYRTACRKISSVSSNQSDIKTDHSCSSFLTDKSLFTELEENALWRKSAQYNPTLKKAEIVALDVKNNEGHSTFDSVLGEPLTFYVLYHSFVNEPIHVTVHLKNRYNQTIFCSGSYNQKVHPPALTSGQRGLFKMNVSMMLEGGQYTVKVTLAVVGSRSIDVEKLDETPELGPLQIIWDYETQRAPFYGMFGLPASSEFRIEP